jgi:hypothetical protein
MSHAFEDCVVELDVPEDEVECSPEDRGAYQVLEIGAERSNNHDMECALKAGEEMKEDVMEECWVSQDKSWASCDV